MCDFKIYIKFEWKILWFESREIFLMLKYSFYKSILLSAHTVLNYTIHILTLFNRGSVIKWTPSPHLSILYGKLGFCWTILNWIFCYSWTRERREDTANIAGLNCLQWRRGRTPAPALVCTTLVRSESRGIVQAGLISPFFYKITSSN